MIQDNTTYFNTNSFVGSNADVDTIDKFDFNSFYRAYVIDNQDPDKLGRVKIRIPSLHGTSTTYPWAYPASLTGFGFQTGMFILPPVGAMVWVTFEYSDEHRPIYFGGIPTTYAEGKSQSYGPFINNGYPVAVTNDDLPFEYTGTQQIIYKSPKSSILYFDSSDINNLIVMKNINGQGIEIASLYDMETGLYDRYTKMSYDDKNYIKLEENKFKLVLDGEEITFEPGSFNNYNELTNKPQINGITLQGNLTAEDLNINEDKNFVYTQNTASDTWTIQHNLNKYPSVTVIDSSNSVVDGDITYIDTNNLTIKFKGGFKGKATLN